MATSRSSYKEYRFLPGYRLLFYIATAAVLIIALDSILESSLFASRYSSRPATNLSDQANDSQEGLGAYHDEDEVSFEPPPNLSTDMVDTQFAMLPLDHQNPTGSKFANRYWVNDRWYRPGGPVFVYDTGESDGSESVERFILRNTSFVGGLLKEFHGVAILWEHRYYGQSRPQGLNESDHAEYYRFLTLDQALADLPYFAQTFHLPSFPDADLRPSSTPWIMLGCSYSGTRAALSRLRHPDTIYAAYAGSAPVLFQAGVHDYYNALHLSLTEHGMGNCSKDLHAIMDHVDKKLDDVKDNPLIKQQFLGAGGEENDNSQFALVLESIYMYFKGWGVFRGKPSIAALCDYLEWDHVANRTAGADGLVDLLGIEHMTGRFAAWKELIPLVNKLFHMNCGNETVPRDTRCVLSVTDAWPAQREWNWQQCSEVGFWIVQNTGPNSLTSQYSALQHQVAQCNRVFPGVFQQKFSISEYIARVDRTNLRFGGLSMRPSNVFWTTGQYDPWRSLSPLARSEIEAGPGSVRVTKDIPLCNTTTGRDSIFGLVVPEVGHCEIIAKRGPQVEEGRRIFTEALRKWLPCFGT